MDSEQARVRVHEFLCDRIEVIPCDELPSDSTFYEFNPAREQLFTFRLFGRDFVGSAEYISVNRDSGEVRYLGFHGE